MFADQLKRNNNEFKENQRRSVRLAEVAKKLHIDQELVDPIIAAMPSKDELLDYALTSGENSYNLWTSVQARPLATDNAGYIKQRISGEIVARYGDSSITVKYNDNTWGGMRDCGNPEFFLHW